MKLSLTSNTLRVFWNGNEAPGLMAYGYWRGTIQPKVPFSSSLWSIGTAYRDYWYSDWEGRGPNWRILERTIFVPTWPAADLWQAKIRKTLQAFLDCGARVAWCGIEGHFVEPPLLFEPGFMGGGVWAALDPLNGYQCKAELSGFFDTLTNSELQALRQSL